MMTFPIYGTIKNVPNHQPGIHIYIYNIIHMDILQTELANGKRIGEAMVLGTIFSDNPRTPAAMPQIAEASGDVHMMVASSK